VITINISTTIYNVISTNQSNDRLKNRLEKQIRKYRQPIFSKPIFSNYFEYFENVLECVFHNFQTARKQKDNRDLKETGRQRDGDGYSHNDIPDLVQKK
jgi:hypothetical protein